MIDHITFRHLEPTDAIKNHINERVERIEKLLPYPVKIEVTVGVDKQTQWAEIRLHAEHKEFVAEARTENLYESIDSAVAKMELQIKKERDQRKGHHTSHRLNKPPVDSEEA